MSPNALSPFSPLSLPMLSSFSLRLSPHFPWSSALSVLLFYCRTLSFGQSSYVFLLYPATNQHPLSLYGSVLFLIGSHCHLFPFMDATYSWLASLPFGSPIRTPLQSPPTTICKRCPLYYIVFLVSSTQSSIVSSPNLEGNHPLRLPLCPLVLHFIHSSHSCVTGPWT